jgi:hypothetical protein
MFACTVMWTVRVAPFAIGPRSQVICGRETVLHDPSSET